ncbi:MAG: hypothetical protein I8H77_14135 [Comamonadaceae bacterium]|nr:hypothetical protein [Comamonadaceae bacterium]
MAENHLGPHITFDRGIDQVTYVRSGETQSLPMRREEAPSELGGRPQLDSLLALPTLDDGLEEAIRPQLADRELMVPSRFHAVLDSLHTALSQRIDGNAGGAADEFMSPEKKRDLKRALTVLGGAQDLRGLVQMYRSVLYQG